jgi:hypothetical protein
MTTNDLLGMLPPFQGAKVKVTQKQSVARIMKEILSAHQDYAADYDRIADYFYTGDETGTEKLLFNFCKENLTYKVESDQTQTVQSPTAILVLGEMRGVDCKHYASFIAGVLDALNRQGRSSFNWFYRFASYDMNDKVPEHVFVVVNNAGYETWIDPVLDYFDDRYPYPIFIKDIKPKKMALYRVSGINAGGQIGSPAGFRTVNYARSGSQFSTGSSCGRVRHPGQRKIGCRPGRIGSQQTTGKTIMTVSVALAPIPVIGWIAAAAGTAVGTLLEIFGKATSLSSGVDKLIERFQYLVLGQNVTSWEKVNEGYAATAQQWFSFVLGVPVYDVYRFYALKGIDPNSLQSYGYSYDQRAQNYFNSAPEVNGLVSMDQAVQAAHIADGMTVYPGVAGSWAGFTAAPSLSGGGVTDLQYNSKGQVVTPAQAAALSPSLSPTIAPVTTSGFSPLLIVGAVALGAFLILRK